MALITYLSSRSQIPDLNQWFENADKVVHFFTYFVLGLCIQFTILSNLKIKYSYVIILVIIIGFAFAYIDEYHQSFVPGRDSSMDDFLADVLGILFSFILIKYLKSIIYRYLKV